jgi:DNA-binding transcriptional regulator YiaG
MAIDLNHHLCEAGYMTATVAEQIRFRLRIRGDLPMPAERRAIREAAGISRQEFAQVVGVTPAAIGHWERGSRTPSGAYLDRYVEAIRALRDAA